MSNDGWIIRIAEEARITNEEAFAALTAAFHGLLDISSPSTSGSGAPVAFHIVVNPPPPPPGLARTQSSPRLTDFSQLIGFISDSAGISVESAGAALGVIIQAIVEGGQASGLARVLRIRARIADAVYLLRTCRPTFRLGGKLPAP